LQAARDEGYADVQGTQFLEARVLRLRNECLEKAAEVEAMKRCILVMREEYANAGGTIDPRMLMLDEGGIEVSTRWRNIAADLIPVNGIQDDTQDLRVTYANNDNLRSPSGHSRASVAMSERPPTPSTSRMHAPRTATWETDNLCTQALGQNILDYLDQPFQFYNGHSGEHVPLPSVAPAVLQPNTPYQQLVARAQQLFQPYVPTVIYWRGQPPLYPHDPWTVLGPADEFTLLEDFYWLDELPGYPGVLPKVSGPVDVIGDQ